MDVAPPVSGSRIEDLGDRLVVRFRTRRSWGGLAFMLVWVAAWTVGGVLAFGALVFGDATLGERAFLLLWLCGWAIGECSALAYIAWRLFGVEALSVTPEALYVRREVGPFARTRRYDVPLVRSIEVTRVPSDTDGRERTDFGLALDYAGETIRIGEALGERDAEYLASLVVARITPRSWWKEDSGDLPPPPVDGIPARGRSWSWVGAVAFPIAFAAVLVLLGVEAYGGEDDPPRTTSTVQAAVSPSAAFPYPEDFTDPSQYAGAVSAWGLAKGHNELLEPLRCSVHSWTNWSCTARVRVLSGGLAGRTFLHECRPSGVDRRHGRPHVSGVWCGAT